MFVNILHNQNNVKKIIHFGSGAEYSKNRDLIRVKENSWGDIIPSDSYGFSKYICHSLGKDKRKVVNLRLFGVYGKYENYLNKFITNSIVKNILGLPIKIKQNVVFDYLYINDLVSIVNYFINKPWHDSDYNVTPNRSINLKQIVQTINQISESKSEIKIVNPGYNFQYSGNNLKLKKLIPNLVFTPYKNGISDLYKYYLKRIKSIDKESLIEDKYYSQSIIKK